MTAPNVKTQHTGSTDPVLDTYIGTVTKVIPHTGEEERPNNHQVNVNTAPNNEVRNVPVLPFANGGMYVPEVGDDVFLYFRDRQNRSPIVLGPVHTAENRAPKGQPGDYRLRRFEEAELEIYKNNNSETILSVTRQPTDGGDPDMGFELNLTTGTFKIGDGSGYGIESDGSGNFTWYINSLNYVDDGSTLDWSRPGEQPK